jgi:hypothetical protein
MLPLQIDTGRASAPVGIRWAKVPTGLLILSKSPVAVAHIVFAEG